MSLPDREPTRDEITEARRKIAAAAGVTAKVSPLVEAASGNLRDVNWQHNAAQAYSDLDATLSSLRAARSNIDSAIKVLETADRRSWPNDWDWNIG